MRTRKAGAAGAALGALMVMGAAAPAGAAPVGLPIDVVVHTQFEAEASSFEGSIPGCETGTVVEGRSGVHGTPWGGVYSGVKHFTCDSGEGGFDVRLTARFSDLGSTGRWTVVDAWGAFEGAHASGSLVGTPTEGGIDDHYTGTAR